MTGVQKLGILPLNRLGRKESVLEYRPVKRVFYSAFIAVTVLWTTCGSISASEEIPYGQASRQYDQVVIKPIAPERAGGHGYQLVYHVNVPIDTYWKFKTDFDNQFLIENKYIRDHRFVSKTDGTAITENRYKYGPDVFFRWQTSLFPDRYRLDFMLMNPEPCTRNIIMDTSSSRPKVNSPVSPRSLISISGALPFGYTIRGSGG